LGAVVALAPSGVVPAGRNARGLYNPCAHEAESPGLLGPRFRGDDGGKMEQDVDARHIGVQSTPSFGRLWPDMTKGCVFAWMTG
jgi:hypothetical protein